MNQLGDVLVTGGAGFIGCALAQSLAASARRWVALDSLHPQVHAVARRPDALPAEAELVVGDVTSASDWDALLADFRPETVIHLAAETGTAQSFSEATRHTAVNVVGTAAMLDAFTRSGHVPDRFVLSSSRAVYGEGDWRTASGEIVKAGVRSRRQLENGEWDLPGATAVPSSVATTVPAPTNVYGATKLAQEHLLDVWCGARDLSLDILRLQNVYGPGQSLTNPYTGIVSLFSRLARAGKAISVYEDGQIVRDFVYIDDVVSAFAADLRGEPAVGVRRYDVGSGVATTILELATEIARYHDAPAPVVSGEFRDGDVRFAACDILPTEIALDWAPEWSLRDGIGSLQAWIAGQAVAETA
ncbi:NAD-dependent epimerase/dehydratase family protein [Leifsonia sp. 2MCAF36]|uniref:NAD-dependent epimerase/dehydratase family protein n=1 Tax=Leifsonia sp. 2MCAF36 TaxID=3232988 RepID=UPI003F9E8351